MPSPFPGMDPYLEDPAIWSGVHAAILAAIFERLAPALRPKYAVRYEERVYVTSEDDPGYRSLVPDIRIIERPTRPAASRPTSASGALAIAEPIKIAQVENEEIHERRLQVIDLKDRAIVTVIELLSPANKRPASFGRETFLQKRREFFATDSHWMEIDLLRDGERTSNPPGVPPSEYQVFLSRAGKPRQSYVWPVSLRDRLPVIGIPLRGNDPDEPLDLQDVLNTAIDRGSYDLDTDYSRQPVLPLSAEHAAWARQCVQARSR